MYRVPSSADRATSQMQGAAGTMAAQTKKQGTETKNPEPGIGQYAMNGLGMVLLADAVGDTDIAEGLMDNSGIGKNAGLPNGGESVAETPITPVETYLHPEESVTTTFTSNGAAPINPAVTPSAMNPSTIGSAPASVPAAQSAMSAQLPTVVAEPMAMPSVATPTVIAESAAPAAMEAAPVVTAQTGSQLMTGGAGAMTAGTTAGTTAMTGTAAGSAMGAAAVPAATTAATTTAATTAATTAGASAAGAGAGAAGGAGAGAAGGAQAGSAAGPWGAAIGAAVGLVAGFLFS